MKPLKMKLQTSSSKLQRNLKRQTSKDAFASVFLEFEIWSFSGAWILELGAF
jgi:hypothetical protein